MRSRWREFIESLLPWFDAALDRSRDRRTEAIRQRSIASRIRAETVIADYRRASAIANRSGKRLIEEARRGDDDR